MCVFIYGLRDGECVGVLYGIVWIDMLDLSLIWMCVVYDLYFVVVT